MPSLENHFEGENGSVKRAERSGISKRILAEETGVASRFCEVVEDFGGVAFGFDGGPDGFDFAGFADEERAADDAHEFAPHELLLLPDAEGGDGFVVGVAEQGEIKFEFGPEQGLRFDRVGAGAEDGYFELVELLFCVTKLGRLDDSTGGVGFGEEEEDDALALEVLERDGLVFVGLQAERGGFVAGLEHGNELFESLAENGQGAGAPRFSRPLSKSRRKCHRTSSIFGEEERIECNVCGAAGLIPRVRRPSKEPRRPRSRSIHPIHVPWPPSTRLGECPITKV